jgi:hypothetical protein
LELEIGFVVAALLLITCIAIFKAKRPLIKWPWRFSVRDIFLLITLVTAVAGLVSYAIVTANKDDASRFKSRGEWAEYQLRRIQGSSDDGSR